MWKRTFNEDFDGTALDPSKWVTGYWFHDLIKGGAGFQGELEWYLPRNVSVSEGCLHLTAKKEVSNGMNWTSGVVTTGRTGSSGPLKFQISSPEYYIEARVQVAAGMGMWSGFWLCAQAGDTPSPYKECDILEYLAKSPNISNVTFHNPNSSTRALDLTTDLPAGQSLSSDFHYYGYRQFPEGRGIWYVDGRARSSFVSSSMRPEIPMYILCNLAVGGWGGTPDPALMRAEMKIDWIRVWERL